MPDPSSRIDMPVRALIAVWAILMLVAGILLWATIV